jgi:hypothetical protein
MVGRQDYKQEERGMETAATGNVERGMETAATGNVVQGRARQPGGEVLVKCQWVFPVQGGEATGRGGIGEVPMGFPGCPAPTRWGSVRW